MEWSGIGVMAEATMEEGSRLGLGVLLVQCCKLQLKWECGGVGKGRGSRGGGGSGRPGWRL